MLVCSVSIRPQRRAVAAAVEEFAEAADLPAIGVIFATLTDDPGTASDRVDGFVGKFMVEAASAADVVDAGSIRYAAVVEQTGALAAPGATVIGPGGAIAAAIVETTASASEQDATSVSASTTAVIDGGFVTSAATSTVLGTEVLDSGPILPFD